MQQDRAEDLLGGVEGPDLDGAAWRLSQPLHRQRRHGKQAQRALHYQSKVAQQVALAIALLPVERAALCIRHLRGCGRRCRCRYGRRGIGCSSGRCGCGRHAGHDFRLHALNLNKFRLKHQRRPTRNRPMAIWPISQTRRNRQLPRLPGTHVKQALIPSVNNLARAQRKGKRSSAIIARVELGAIFLQSAPVVHRHRVAILRLASALDLVRDVDAEFLCGGEVR
jgi:hypothetical protein